MFISASNGNIESFEQKQTLGVSPAFPASLCPLPMHCPLLVCSPRAAIGWSSGGRALVARLFDVVPVEWVLALQVDGVALLAVVEVAVVERVREQAERLRAHEAGMRP